MGFCSIRMKQNIAYFDQCLISAGYPPLKKEQHEKVIYMSVRQLLMEIINSAAETDRVLKIPRR